MMSKKNVTLYYGLIMAVYSIAYVTMSAFSSVYLLDVGFSNGNVGVLLAIGSLLSVFLQPVVGSLIDRNKRVSSKGVILVIAILVVIFGVMIITIPGKGIFVNALLYGTVIMLLMLGQPFLNALGMEAINNGFTLNLGIGRSIGSLGYALGSYAFGIISVKAGPRSVPVAFSIAFLVLCILIFIYPVKDSDLETVEKQKVEKDNPFLFLVRYKRFAVMLLGLILVYFSHALINVFALQIVTPKGGTSGDMGTASAIAAGCELITAFLFTWYMSKFRLSNILKVSGVFFTLKILFSMLATNVTQFYIIQAFQMFGWGFMTVGIVYYVNELVGASDKAQGQAYAGMSYTIASVLATFLGGNIIDIFGVDKMLLAGTVSAAIGTVILIFTMKDISKKKAS